MIHEEPSFAEMLSLTSCTAMAMLRRIWSINCFNSSEKRLARTLLLVANFGKEGEPEPILAKNQPRDARGDDWHDAISRQWFHEQISTTRPY